jgi:hypothetical protein
MAFRFVAERRVRVIADVVCQSHMELLMATEKARALLPSDCDPVRYTREVFGDTNAPFVASCSILRNQPPSASASYDRLVVEVRTPFEGREIVSTFSTYVVHR